MISQARKRLPLFKRRIIELCRQERGATLIYVALVLPALLGFAALAVDASNLYAQQGRMQTAADAAALAGSQRLAQGDTTTQVRSEVQTFVTSNGANSFSLSFLNSNTELQVTAIHTFTTFFAGMIGYPTLSTRATSNARYAAITSAGNLLPMTVMCDDMANDADPAFTYGATYILYNGSMNAPGNRGWVTWNGSVSANVLADNITHPSNSGVWHVGDWVGGTPGSKTSALSELSAWINKPVTIPLYDTVTGNGSNVRYHICTFAEFVLLSYDKNSVTGKFIRSFTHQAGTSSGNPPDFGVRDVHITH